MKLSEKPFEIFYFFLASSIDFDLFSVCASLFVDTVAISFGNLSIFFAKLVEILSIFSSFSNRKQKIETQLVCLPTAGRESARTNQIDVFAVGW